MTKKKKVSEAEHGDKPCASKRKASSQQSAPLASAISILEKTKKPKAVAAEAAPCPPEVAKGTSATNVAEEERKMPSLPSLPKYAAVPREVFRAGPVEAQGVAADKIEEVEEEEDNDEEDKKKEDKEGEEKEEEDGDDDSVSSVNEEEESVDEGSNDNPEGSAGDGTVHLADDVDNLPDEVKPSQKEKVSSPFDLPILPIAKTLLVKQEKKGKKGKKAPDSDEFSILLLSNDEVEVATPLRSQKKKEMATKLPAAGSSNKVGTAKSSEDVLMTIQGAQEEFFNLPWKSYVSVTLLFS